MDNMTEKQQSVALWRYGIIAPLLHQHPEGACMNEMLHRQAQEKWLHPNGRHITLSEDTIRKWLYRFRQGGLPALADQTRSDQGSSSVTAKIASALFETRRLHPRWTVKRVLNEIKRDGVWNGHSPSRSTLYRFIKSHNLGRDPHLQTKSLRSFSFDAFGQLWVADFLHGPKIRMAGKRQKTYLHVIMDDCSRYGVWAEFTTAETVQVLISHLMLATRRFGLPQRFYTDNGPCYASRHLKIVCARLGIQLVHTPPYRPQGRGKIERFFRTVRDQFLDGPTFPSLKSINDQFQQWLCQYHEHPHASLNGTPLQARLAAEQVCRRLPETADTDALFRMERRCRVYNDGTIRLFRHSFEVPGCLPNSRVTVYFLPWDLKHVYYGDDMTLARPLNPTANAQRFRHPQGGSHDPSTHHS